MPPFEAAYLALLRSGKLGVRAAEARRHLQRCNLCANYCRVDRLMPASGARCHTGERAVVCSYGPHFGEEGPLVGRHGSGTIFFSWCNLKCVFCQNWDVSNEGDGEEVDAETLADIMLALQGRGCHNINFVTPEHVVPQILEALPRAIARGLRLPLVYNTSAYDSLDSLRLMDGVVDIYMPDFKYWETHTSSHFLKARDYPERARAAIAEMHRQVGDLEIDEQGVARRGVLVRHLVMPGGLEESADIFAWLARLSPETYVNVMDQYRPEGRVLREPARYPGLARRTTRAEHERARELAHAAGLRRLDDRRPHAALKARFAFRRL